MYFTWRIMLCALLLTGACREKTTRALVWSDEFDTTGVPDTTRWGYDLGNANGWGNNEKQYYTRDARNARVENGKLIIEAHQDSIEGVPYSSARLVSKTKGDWTHGRVEVSARLPRGRGTWPAIWMLPTDWKYGGWPASGEIDIMEHVGYDPAVIHGTIHCELYNHGKQTQKEGKITIADAQDTFHRYAIDWAKDKIDFYVDDTLYHTVVREPKDDYKGWPFDERFHLLMNLAVGGNWGGKEGIDTTIWPQRMEVDYVRIYQ
ncbi:glycoside hydrolase family 16 protein [Parachryseolinea silvisoli]|uniref:glycoside hydrolase family 16 protein n=1 Tax=Parachryseolinea silvisoli TaxID=2873601 RepID=UPI0022659A01|nr:glycoside hydrolase family 16 protein [Parachryseolinea silvisoli]MCD9018983.1 glycoside hydrolase family 16 protein [Parachryseolinea silvisoli]